MKNYVYLKEKKCIDCSKIICNVSIRCKYCSNKFRTGKYNKIKTGKAKKLQGFAYMKTNNLDMFNQVRTINSELRRNIKNPDETPNWQGGISFEPYTLDFNKIFKEQIKKRDNYICLLCDIFDEDSKKLYKKGLAIHHIDYNKLNSFPQNCISLCLRCNILVNKDREIWTKHFQELLVKLYGYQYTQDQKIILDFTQNEEKC